MKDSFLVERFRFLVKTRDKYNQSLTTIYNMLYSIMFRVNDNYSQGIFTQNKLTNYFTSLEEISFEFKSLNLPLTVKDITEITILKLNKIVTRLNEKIQAICQECGAKNIDDTFYIATGNRLTTVMNGKSEEYTKLLLFFNKMYVPTSYKIYRNSNKENSKDLTLYKNNPKDFLVCHCDEFHNADAEQLSDRYFQLVLLYHLS